MDVRSITQSINCRALIRPVFPSLIQRPSCHWAADRLARCPPGCRPQTICGRWGRPIAARQLSRGSGVAVVPTGWRLAGQRRGVSLSRESGGTERTNWKLYAKAWLLAVTREVNKDTFQDPRTLYHLWPSSTFQRLLPAEWFVNHYTVFV